MTVRVTPKMREALALIAGVGVTGTARGGMATEQTYDGCRIRWQTLNRLVAAGLVVHHPSGRLTLTLQGRAEAAR